MKISQLVLREDLYQILEDTIKNNSFFSKLSSIEDDYDTYKSFQYLNIIISESLQKNVREALVFEYTLSKSTVKRLLQKTYVYLAFLPGMSRLFVHEKLKLHKKLNYFAIVPGNHRVRFFSSDLKEIILLLKEGERAKFVENEIKARHGNNISYAPRIISHGDDWLIEEFVEGVPLNRVRQNFNVNKTIDSLIQSHLKELINKEKNTLAVEEYIKFCLDEIHTLTEIVSDNSEKETILNTVVKILDSIRADNLADIEVSMTHGDFQKGNIRINSKNEIFVLDWEAADSRFYLYDLFVMFSEIRSGNDLESSFKLFFNDINKFDNIEKKYSKKMIKTLLCFEELRFHMNEDISENYFNSGGKCSSVAKRINNYLFS